ncbi:unnamed protein product [Cuscuta epithymum]|uniref:Reverse transcriptase zinc-binding domain-containing protein n=1 Tax=Cuscuta epithymum TaxID=186058 RepID=A0AAV0CYT7_9ASTE|nr:unnamed protein product [Cuscuta epithymum]
MWQLKIPPKVKHFFWQTMVGSLPTADRLIQKRVNIAGDCQICKREPESVWHVFWKCPLAQEIWEKLGVRQSCLRTDFMEWIKAVFTSLSEFRRKSLQIHHVNVEFVEAQE